MFVCAHGHFREESSICTYPALIHSINCKGGSGATAE